MQSTVHQFLRSTKRYLNYFVSLFFNSPPGLYDLKLLLIISFYSLRPQLVVHVHDSVEKSTYVRSISLALKLDCDFIVLLLPSECCLKENEFGG